MTIQAGDIKLVASSVMLDVPEGGGAPSSTIINDASTNTIFPDISEIDRAGGRVNLRKVFATVRTADTDGYYGVNVIVSEPFEDPRVSATLFTTNSAFDRRAQAASRMEAYLARGATYAGLLFGNHLAGQSVILLLQRPEVALPSVGQTLVLTKNETLVNEFSQFVRITDVSAIERTFTDAQGADFVRLQVTCELSSQLEQDFSGFDALRSDALINYTGKTRVSETVVADASRYYGVVPLTAPVAIGDFSAQASSIFTQLVPSTRIEVPIADARMNQQSGPLVPAGVPFTRTLSAVFTTAQRLFVGIPILPGSLSIVRAGITLTDRGGALVDNAQTSVGLVDYDNGILALNTNVFGTGQGDHAVTLTPASAPTLVNDTFEVPVTIESQRLNYTFSLDSTPAPRTLRVSYRSQGNWYTLSDDGSGALRGSESSIGAGSLNQTTGTVAVTLGALPDVGSSVIAVYYSPSLSRPVTTLGSNGPGLPRALSVPVSLGKTIKPGTLTLSWNDGTARTATDSAGLLTGDATGSVIYAEGKIDFRPNVLPPVGTTVSVTVTEASAASHTVVAFTDGGVNWTATLPAPIRENSLALRVSGSFDPNGAGSPGAAIGVTPGELIYRTLRLFDNGAGALMLANGNGTNVAVGTVNYSTGAISIPKTLASYVTSQAYNVSYSYGASARYITVTRTLSFLNGSSVQTDAAIANYSGVDIGAAPSTFTVSELFLPANSNGSFATFGVSPKITAFNLGSNFFTVPIGGSLVTRNPDPATGAGTSVGARSVVGGMSGISITTWAPGGTSAVTNVIGSDQPQVAGAGTPVSVVSATFRTASSPLVSGGFQIAGNFTTNGNAFSATADGSGKIMTGSAPVGVTPGTFGVVGLVNYEMGVCRVWFGRRVPSSMATELGVIDLSDLNIVGLQYFQVTAVQADTLRYNATAYSYIPLSASILGLDPVRLPADGRVPIFRQGTFAVLGHTGRITATVSNGQTINCARTRLSRVRVIGNDGQVIDTGYTADLDLGTVTFSNVAGYSQPVTVEHRIEDTVLVSDAQISGLISFTRPSTHVYPVPGSYISSALVAGDVQARVQPAFDQVSWTNVWSDAPIGSSATGSFNDTLYPITTTNLGALTERWAVRFTNTTSFEVFGENVGVIATGNTGTNCSPMNPATGVPYFTIPSAGWGLGWSAGNVLRFNTVGAIVPIWIARTILQGPETVQEDKFEVLVRGDVNRP